MARNRGFTLIEVLITVAIVGLLASIAMPLAELSTQRAKERELRHALREIRDALDAYKRASDEGRIMRSPDQSGYPPSLTTLVEGVTDAKSPSGQKIFFLRRVPRDPFFADLSVPPEKTWGLRSYDSPPDNPRSGADVFDAYTRHAGTGLNGIPYRQW